MPSLSRFNFSCCGLVFTALLMLPAMVLANSGQFQATMTVRAGCSTMPLPSENSGLGYLCSPSPGDFRLSLDGGRNGDGTQRYLSDGQTRTPYRLQVVTAKSKLHGAEDVFSIRLSESARTLMLQTVNTPIAPEKVPTGNTSSEDTVLAIFEY